ncbi:XDD3 family exosortase-dependent surface protein [Anabaena sp. WFMT]|uniref:XDD3 family exosortase-dependent surface protein n=1 Tax=Anabaena sp. WFMT TaxID=3449730 RepID=UPI003F29402E
MKTILKASGIIIAGLTLSLFHVKAVLAGTVHNNWYYAFDSLTDSISGTTVGGTKYEIAGIAYGEKSGQSIFAIVSKLPLEGTSSSFAADGVVAWGDILLNFTTDSFNVASEKGNLMGIRFVNNNAAGVHGLGLYDNVVAKSVTTANGLALANVGAYHNYVQNNGGTPSMGDLALNTSEIDSSKHILNVIDSGNWKGNINLLDANALQNLGFDSSHFGVQGYNTIGISLDSSLLPNANFTTLLSPECGNDIMALIYGKKSVPESSTTLGLLIFGTVGSLVIRNRKKSVAIS